MRPCDPSSSGTVLHTGQPASELAFETPAGSKYSQLSNRLLLRVLRCAQGHGNMKNKVTCHVPLESFMQNQVESLTEAYRGS